MNTRENPLTGWPEILGKDEEEEYTPSARSNQKGMDYMQAKNNNSTAVVGVQKRHATKINLENRKIIRKHCITKISWIKYLSK